MPDPQPTLWYPVMNRWHDQTGISHAEHPGPTLRPLCGATFSGTLGGGTHDPENQHGTQKCPRCLSILKGKTP